MHVQHLKLRAAITATHEQEYVVFTVYFGRQNNNHIHQIVSRKPAYIHKTFYKLHKKWRKARWLLAQWL